MMSCFLLIVEVGYVRSLDRKICQLNIFDSGMNLAFEVDLGSISWLVREPILASCSWLRERVSLREIRKPKTMGEIL